MVYFFLLDFIFVAHLHTALSANAQPRWEYMDATKFAPKALQSMPVRKPTDGLFQCVLDFTRLPLDAGIEPRNKEIHFLLVT